ASPAASSEAPPGRGPRQTHQAAPHDCDCEPSIRTGSWRRPRPPPRAPRGAGRSSHAAVAVARAAAVVRIVVAAVVLRDAARAVPAVVTAMMMAGGVDALGAHRARGE